jgi:hypothetical protein
LVLLSALLIWSFLNSAQNFDKLIFAIILQQL